MLAIGYWLPKANGQKPIAKSKMRDKQGINEELEIPNGITMRLDSGILSVKGPKGELKKEFLSKEIKIAVDNNTVSFVSVKKKKFKKMIGTYLAHVKNIFKGVNEGHKYILKICSGHFPMNVSVSKNELIVKNLLGEKVPRILKLKNNVDVKVDGELVTVESINKELAGQCAADIEQLTRRTNYDTRVFQDGIYIINKDGKELK